MGRVSPFITIADCYLFSTGTHYEIYRKLGAHFTVCAEEAGVYFAVWAPHAAGVSVAGDFNDWSLTAHPMTPIADSGIFECFIPGVLPGSTYKYAVRTRSGDLLLKADPYGVQTELRPSNVSVVADTQTLDEYPWTDGDWIARRQTTDPRRAPLAIYEVHPGSWKHGGPSLSKSILSKDTLSKDTSSIDPASDERFLNYRQLAHELADYVLSMGYTHVELMGIAEHPYDGSWGYQVTGYYAPTARHGSPQDFMYLVDHLHSRGIGVILDWVPAHFPKDPHGLAEFNGSFLYEPADPALREHPGWGTHRFDYRRPQVSNFLIANALYWVEQYHVDGLRVDAVASMLDPDHGGDSGQWSPEQASHIPSTERENGAADLLRRLNQVMSRRHPGTLMIAEDSSTWPGVTAPVEAGGLGFSFKWNMGWMHDFLSYLQRHPMMRGQCHDRLTFSMTYAFREQYLLPLSHDEVVHLKRSLLSKMPGQRPEQIANLKLAYTFMMGHPGKKLLFMGQDFGQLQEWDEARSLDWFRLYDPLHWQLHDFYRDLLHLYTNTPAMYEDDTAWDGFQWINCDDDQRSVLSFLRLSRDGSNQLVFVCNFSPMAYEDYRVGVPCQGPYTWILDENGMRRRNAADPLQTGASTERSTDISMAVPVPCDQLPYSLTVSLPAYGIQVYRFDQPHTKK